MFTQNVACTVRAHLSMAKVICLRACQSSTGYVRIRANIIFGRFPETSESDMCFVIVQSMTYYSQASY